MRSRTSSTIGYSRFVMRAVIIAVVLAASTMVTPIAQDSLGDSARRRTFDQLLDLYVRGGDVYYRALKSDRAKLDGYLNLVAGASIDKLSREEQIAFWLNAYDALVLRTVIDHYPIQGNRRRTRPKAFARFRAPSSGCRTAWPAARSPSIRSSRRY